MNNVKKTADDLLDDLYSLACWMTGNEGLSQELVKKTYLYASPDFEENTLLRMFRDCYVEQFGQEEELWFTEKNCQENSRITDSLKQWAADIKFSVLLSDISELSERQIAEVLRKPLETIRVWLFWGRKFFVNHYLSSPFADS
ncbi:MAG: RNA polymerase subunit sigma-24 [Chlorobium sp.]|nr:MAG: RNA polymerase subunit sigma-24 [Chlorobium sp.]